MSNYKDFIINNNKPEDKPIKNSNIAKQKIKYETEDEKIIEEVTKYIEYLKQDVVIKRRNEFIFNDFDNLTGMYKLGACKKMYEIYKKYHQHPDMKDIMDTNILRSIESYYKKQLREEKNDEKKRLCLMKGHTYDDNWSKVGPTWVRKCLNCGYEDIRNYDPNRRTINNEEKKTKGIRSRNRDEKNGKQI